MSRCVATVQRWKLTLHLFRRKLSRLVSCVLHNLFLFTGFRRRFLYHMHVGWRHDPRKIHWSNRSQACVTNLLHFGQLDFVCFEKNYLIFASIALLTTEIKPQIQNCKPGYKGSFCDQKCTNADLSKQRYTTGCTVACKKGFSLLKGKCTSKSDCHFWISLFCISSFFLLNLNP